MCARRTKSSTLTMTQKEELEDNTLQDPSSAEEMMNI
jgi:hypothetical protein